MFSLNHQQISFVKSAIRIIGYFMLFYVAPAASLVLVLSEFVGVAEEIGH